MSHIINVTNELAFSGKITPCSGFDGTTVVILKKSSNELRSMQQFSSNCSTIVIDGDILSPARSSLADMKHIKVTACQNSVDIGSDGAVDGGLDINGEQQHATAESISRSINVVDQRLKISVGKMDHKKSGCVVIGKKPVRGVSKAISNDNKDGKAVLSGKKIKTGMVPDASSSSKPDEIFASSNPSFFTTSCAPDSSSFIFQCQSCLIIRFDAYEKLRSHEDWCGRRKQSEVGVSCQNCGLRYKNLVVLYRHALEVHSSGVKNVLPVRANPYNFSTVCAIDAEDFPHVCVNCKTVCFRSQQDRQLHESWCGQNTLNENAAFLGSGKNQVCKSPCQASSGEARAMEKPDNLSQIAMPLNDSPRDDFALRPTLGNGVVVEKQEVELSLKIDSVYSIKRNRIHRLLSKDKSKHSSSLIRCLDCCSGFETRLLLTQHKKFCPVHLSSKGRLDSSSSVVRCSDCGSGFGTRPSLYKHRKSCGKVTSQSNERSSHEKRDSREVGTAVEPHSEIDASIVKKCLVDVNQQIQSMSPKSICCLNCNKMFNSRLLMEQHKRSRTCGLKAVPLDDVRLYKQAKRFTKVDKVRVDKKNEKSQVSVRSKRKKCGTKVQPSAKSNWKLRLLNSSPARKQHKSSSKSRNRLKNKEECEQIVRDKASAHSKTSIRFEGNNLNSKPVFMDASDFSNQVINDNVLKTTGCCTMKLSKDEAVVTFVNASKAMTSEIEIGESVQSEQAGMLSLLNLVPTSCTAVNSQEVMPRYASQRKRKSIINRFDPSDFHKPKQKTSVVQPQSVKKVKSRVPVVLIPLKHEVDQVDSQFEGISQLKSSNCEAVEEGKNSVEAVKKSGATKRREKSPSTLSALPRSLRTLEPVGDKALKCAFCGTLLKTVRQIVTHGCQG